MTLNLMQAIESASGVAAGAFVSGIWQGIVLAAGVWLCLRMLPKTTAAVRFLIWSAVFAVLALLPFLHTLTPRTGETLSSHAAGAMKHAIHVDVRWSFAIAALWAIFSTMRAVQLMAGAVRLRNIWKRATPVAMTEKTNLLQSGVFASEAALRGVQLCTSTDVDCPSVIGFFAPRVLIPADLFERLTAPELEQIVLHEVGHLRRADDWINLLQKIGLVLFPLNPALMWIERRLCFERELACDDSVLQLTKAPKAYATCLATLAERRLGRRAAALSLGAWERQSELSRRVYSILRRGERMSQSQARVVFSVLVLGLLGGATELSRCPQLVSFSRPASPVSAETRMLPAADYQPIAFRQPSAAHATLLKASMPLRREVSESPAQTLPHRIPHAHRPALHRVKKSRAQTQQWVVLTSWDTSSGARMVMTVSQEQISSPSYAAVPTPGGWLVFQL
jgi:beta-lactamase regulating signal transducer with metallopeptidase domain